MTKVTAKEIYDAVVRADLRALKDWYEKGSLSSERLNAIRFGEKHQTVLHVAINNPENYEQKELFVWLIGKVSAKLLEIADRDGVAPLEMVRSRIKKITDKTSPGEDFADSLSYAIANTKREKLTTKRNYKLERLRSMEEALKDAFKNKISAKLMGVAIEHGSLVGVKMVHKHFPEIFDCMDHHDMLDLIEQADDLGHAHISEYICNVAK